MQFIIRKQTQHIQIDQIVKGVQEHELLPKGRRHETYQIRYILEASCLFPIAIDCHGLFTYDLHKKAMVIRIYYQLQKLKVSTYNFLIYIIHITENNISKTNLRDKVANNAPVI